tara:strand:+ start:2282 stop:2479 length:198 start_codon:yes stop_codon:yes gene_type:complete
LIPTLSVVGGLTNQSTAVMKFIKEAFEGPSLLSEDPVARARSRAFAQVIACEMHPINVVRVKPIW